MLVGGGNPNPPTPVERSGKAAAHRMFLPAGGGHHLGDACTIVPGRRRGKRVEPGGRRGLGGCGLRFTQALRLGRLAVFGALGSVVIVVSSVRRRLGRRRYRGEPGYRA